MPAKARFRQVKMAIRSRDLAGAICYPVPQFREIANLIDLWKIVEPRRHINLRFSHCRSPFFQVIIQQQASCVKAKVTIQCLTVGIVPICVCVPEPLRRLEPETCTSCRATRMHWPIQSRLVEGSPYSPGARFGSVTNHVRGATLWLSNWTRSLVSPPRCGRFLR
jgi:hypothetical protein